jgi:hypothetical protein
VGLVAGCQRETGEWPLAASLPRHHHLFVQFSSANVSKIIIIIYKFKTVDHNNNKQ